MAERAKTCGGLVAEARKKAPTVPYGVSFSPVNVDHEANLGIQIPVLSTTQDCCLENLSFKHCTRETPWMNTSVLKEFDFGHALRRSNASPPWEKG